MRNAFIALGHFGNHAFIRAQARRYHEKMDNLYALIGTRTRALGSMLTHDGDLFRVTVGNGEGRIFSRKRIPSCFIYKDAGRIDESSARAEAVVRNL